MTMIVLSGAAMSVYASRFVISSELAAASLVPACTNVESMGRDQNRDQIHPWLAGLPHQTRQLVAKASGGFAMTRL